MTLTALVALVAVGVVAGIVNTLAGGGTMLTMPVLIFAGLPPHAANATARIGVAFQVVAAWWSWRGDGPRGAPLRAVEWVPALVGGVIGAVATRWLSAPELEDVIAVSMLVLLVPTLAPPAVVATRPRHPALIVLGMLAIGLYGGFLQGGVGFFLLAGLRGLSGRELTDANRHKTTLTGIFTAASIVIFVVDGLIAWAPGVALGAGSAVGGYVGGRLATRVSATPIKVLLVLMCAASAGRLLGWW